MKQGKRDTAMVASSARRFHLALLVALLAVLARAVPSYAKCDPTTDPDKTDITNARAAIAANCPCTGAAVAHGTYVSCAAQQANTVLVSHDWNGTDFAVLSRGGEAGSFQLTNPD
jgi:hypothetical protein